MSAREKAVDKAMVVLAEAQISAINDHKHTPFKNLGVEIVHRELNALRAANLVIVPANLLDAVIAAVDEAFCYNPVTKRSKIQVARTDVIAAIRAAWEGATDGD